jgi:anti-sigma factor RsiW
MSRCPDVETLIAMRVDRTTTPAEDARLDAHLAACPECTALLAEEAAIDALLAARFAGAGPSAAFDAAIRGRIRAERRAVHGWIPDVLNAAGVLLVLLASVPAALGWGGLAGVALGTAALMAGLYPMLLAMWVTEAGSGEPDPARQRRAATSA